MCGCALFNKSSFDTDMCGCALFNKSSFDTDMCGCVLFNKSSFDLIRICVDVFYLTKVHFIWYGYVWMCFI